MTVIEASIDDIRELALHHRKMFEEIWAQEGKIITKETLHELEKAYCEKLEEQIPEGSCNAWIVNNSGQIVASGAITIVSFVPVPNDPNHKIAYLHSMYTEKNYRGRKYAQKIIERAIQYCKGIGINRVILNASEAGRPIYEASGFTASPKAMVSFINN